MSKFRKYYNLREAAAATLPINDPTDAAMAHDDYEERGVDGFQRLVELLQRMLGGIDKDLERAREWVKEWQPPEEPYQPGHDDTDYWDDDAYPTQGDYADYAKRSQEYQDKGNPRYWDQEGCLGPAMSAWNEFSKSCYYLRDVVDYGRRAIQKRDTREMQAEKTKAAEYLGKVMQSAKTFSQTIKQECGGNEEQARQHILKGPLPAVVNSVVEWIMRGRLLELAQS